MCILTLEESTGKGVKERRQKLAMMDLKLAVVFLAVLHLIQICMSLAWIIPKHLHGN